MRVLKLLFLSLVVASAWGIGAFTPGIAGGGGGIFVDVAANNPAYPYLRYLLDRGIISVGSSGEFHGDQPLSRFDGAVWLAKGMQYLEKKGTASVAGDIQGLSQRVDSLEVRLGNLERDVARNGQDIQTLKSSYASLNSRVGTLERQGVSQSQGIAQKAQMAFVLGVTGVILGLAALAMAIFF